MLQIKNLSSLAQLKEQSDNKQFPMPAWTNRINDIQLCFSCGVMGIA